MVYHKIEPYWHLYHLVTWCLKMRQCRPEPTRRTRNRNRQKAAVTEWFEKIIVWITGDAKVPRDEDSLADMEGEDMLSNSDGSSIVILFTPKFIEILAPSWRDGWWVESLFSLDCSILSIDWCWASPLECSMPLPIPGSFSDVVLMERGEERRIDPGQRPASSSCQAWNARWLRSFAGILRMSFPFACRFFLPDPKNFFLRAALTFGSIFWKSHEWNAWVFGSEPGEW